MNKHAYLILVQKPTGIIRISTTIIRPRTSRFIYPYRQKAKKCRP